MGRSSSRLVRPKHHLLEARATENGSWKSELYVDRWIRSLDDMQYEIRIVEECPADETNPNDWLNRRERHWIAFYRERGDRLTNATDGGIGLLGYHHTDETKQKIAAAKNFLGKTHSIESREKIGRASRDAQKDGGFRLGVKHTEETKARIAMKQLGSTRPQQSGDLHWTRDPKRTSKPGVKGTRVLCENDGLEFESGIAAARHYGVSGPVVNRALDGHNNRRGLRFRRIDVITLSL